MMMWSSMIKRLPVALCLAALCLASLASPVLAEPIPANAEAMLRAAAAKSDGALASTADVAKKAFPKSEKEIDALMKQARETAEARRQRKLRHLGLLRGWKGQGNAGFSDSQGNNNSTGVTVGVNLVREGLAWTHKADANMDFQRDNGKETRGRYFTAYQSNYRFSDRLYLLGLASWESDRFAGFDSRTTEALGFGYTLIREPNVSLSVEGGPALRQVRITKDGSRNKFASRAAVNYSWSLLPNLKITQNMSYYGEDKDSTVTSTTALTMGLIGSLSLQASYLARYESDPPTAAHRYDGTTRTSLVYSF
jgi:putative salt-induced outer membrane protein